jgi:hypothetical protein
MRDSTERFHLTCRGAAVLGALALSPACADVGTGPSTPASIELAPFSAPAVVLGDSLRDEGGAVSQVKAVVRNSAGDLIDNAAVTYLYAEYNRDSALTVDSARGIVRANGVPKGEARIAARVGGALQVLRPLIVTVRPDSVEAKATPASLKTVLPDTGRTAANANSTSALSVLVSNRQGTAPAGVNGWLVRFTLVKPANTSNDTAAVAFLVNDNGTASGLDTTDSGGNAGRRVRVRAALFPTAGTDTVVVRATVTYKGRPVAGSGVLVRALVTRGAP